MPSAAEALSAPAPLFSRWSWRRLGGSRMRRWSLKLASYASLNILGRVVQMLAAFIVVRSLAKTDYAWYSLAQNLVGALGMFTVTGIATGMMPIAGEAAGDRERMGVVLASAARFRALLLAFGALTVLPVFAHLLHHSDCPPWQNALLTLAALISTITSIASQMMATPLSLARRYNDSQIEVLMQSLLRLVLVVALVYFSFASATSVMIVTVLAPLPTLMLWLAPRAREHADYTQKADPEITAKLRKHFFVGLPTNLTYLFEAQIAAFIVAWFGHMDQVADLGAIGRVALILQVPIGIVSGILVPRMSEEKNMRRLWKMWVSSSLLGAAVGLAALAGGWFLRTELLWLIGPAYSGLEFELVLFLAFTVFAFITTIVSTPIQSRGWVRHSWIRPLMVFGSQAVAACFLDLTSVTGAIGLMWAGSLGNAALNTFLLINGWRGRATL
jgi:O-antigen/teichoic acid export membrane protein